MVRLLRTLSGNTGLTLIEVLSAIGLMGVLTAVAATNFNALVPGFRVRGAALRVAGDMNQARMSAIKEGRFYEFFPIGGGYRIRRDNRVGGIEVVQEVVLANEFPNVSFGTSGLPADPYGDAIAAAVPAGAVTFESNGIVRNPAGVFLETPDAGGLAQQAVTLSAAGRVRVWRYEGGWH